MGEQQTLFQLPFDASFQLNELKRIHFLTESPAEPIEVDVKKHSCSCGEAKCAHLVEVVDIVANKGRSFRYVAKSALHKEIRRGDMNAAVRWSRWVRACGGDADLKRYLRGIILEETRNLDLLCRASKLPSDQLVRLLTASTKKWELPTRAGVFAPYVGAYARAKHVWSGPRDIPPERDLDWWLTAFWSARMSSDVGVVASFENLLTFEARARGGWALRLMNHAKRREHTILGAGFYEAKVLVEMFCGKWTEDANVVEQLDEVLADKDEVPSIPIIGDYVYDNHTAVGMGRFSENLGSIAPHQPLPAGVDMRWAGLLRGVLWREWAAREFPGRYLDVGWVMPVSPDIWGNVCEADGFLHKKLYKRAGL